MQETRPKRRIETWRRYASFLRRIVRLQPRLFALAVGGAFLFALFTVASSITIRWVIDQVIVPRFESDGVATSTAVWGCLLIVGVGVVRGLGITMRRFFAGSAQWRIAEGLATQVTDRYAEQPASWHQRHADGQLIARAGVDVETTVAVMAPLPFACGTVLMLVAAAVWLIATDVLLGVVAVAVFPLLMLLNVVYEGLVARHFDDAQRELGSFSGAVHESFEAVQLVKAYGAEERETERLSEIAGRIRDARVQAVHVSGVFEALLDVIPSLTNIGIVALGATRVDAGALTIGELSGFIYMFTLLVFPLRLIGYAMSELPHSSAGFTRIDALLGEPVDADPAETIGHADPPTGVLLDDVSYVFRGNDQPAVSPTTLSLRAGAVAAIVGATGSGKSTLVSMIGGLLRPTAGRVAVAGGERAIVFQEGFLFGATVRENVAAGASVDDAEVWHALAMACAEQFVRELPDGLDTMVGERGVTLSGGQRQRVALARALVRQPAVLVLDDTTSALDPATERTVLANLRSELHGATVVMVASRPSTIGLADEVYFLQLGDVVASGTHDELMQTVPPYRQLIDAFEADRAEGVAR